MQTKKIFLVSIIGALLLAGLYLFLSREVQKSPSIIKPSQLDFKNSNQIQEPTTAGQSASATTESVAQVTPEAVSSLSAPEQKLWANLEEILKTKNDSDSRVSELKNLSLDFHKALTDKYSSLKPEDRNGRGFVVFLISKDLKSPSDLDFLQKVYQEAPCLSLENCAVSGAEESPHTAGVNQTTLIYPQLVALYQIEKQLEAQPNLLNNPEMRAGILATLKQAEAFPVPSVREQAEKIRLKYQL